MGSLLPVLLLQVGKRHSLVGILGLRAAVDGALGNIAHAAEHGMALHGGLGSREGGDEAHFRSIL